MSNAIEYIEGEVWKDAAGYAGMYQVSNKGRVKSLDRATIAANGSVYHLKSKLMALIDAGQKYLIAKLSKNGKARNERVNILVAKVFKHNDDPVNKTQVNHLDGDKSNNNDWNLEWSTPKENAIHARTVLGHKNNPGNWSNAVPIIVIYPNGIQEECKGIKTVANKLGLKAQGIYRVLNNIQPVHKGYSFKYKIS